MQTALINYAATCTDGGAGVLIGHHRARAGRRWRTLGASLARAATCYAVQMEEPTSPRVDPEHEARAVAAIARALTEIPFYTRRQQGRGALAPTSTLADVLAAQPLLGKHDIRATLPKQWVPASFDLKAALASGDVELVETSGSTSDRLRVLWDKGWWLRQEDRAMRINPIIAAAHAGARVPYRESILTTPVCGLATCHAGDLTYDERIDEHRLFLNMRPDPTFWRDDDMTRMLDELAKHRTVGLESDPMYLATLARHASAQGRTLDVTGFVQLTYAFTTRGHLRAIRKAYDGPIFQLYGASEVGVLFMEAEDGRLHHAPFTTHVELLRAKVPTPGAKDVALVVVTTLDRAAQPLVRFVVGDVAQVDWDEPRRYTTVPPIRSVEGRIQDALVRPDGAIVTCGAIDRALGEVEAVTIFQIDQRTPGEVEVDIVVDGDAGDAVDAATRALAPLTEGLTVHVRTATAIAAEASGKFRLVRRHFPIDMGRSFEGCDALQL